MTKRFYSGARDSSSSAGAASKMKKLEIQKGGKLPITSAQRYKMMVEAKLEDARAQSSGKSKTVFTPPGAKPITRTLSHKAEQALKEISQRKAAKKEKELRRMVPIVPCNYQDGRLDAKGKIWDVANNQTLKINHKTGKVTTMGGWTIGKYKPKSLMNRMMINDAIKKHSPYHIRLRQIQMLQEQERLRMLQMEGQMGLAAQQTLAQLYGNGMQDPNNPEAQQHMDMYQRMGANANAWGVMSGNVHGTFAENVHGGMADNVWGTASANVWGGIGGGWKGMRGPRIWNSGAHNQKNYLKPVFAFFASFFNFRGTRGAFRNGRTGGGGR
jgi:hypothetical protein